MPRFSLDTTHLPLLQHASANDIVAWQNGRAIRVRQFLSDVSQLAAMLPADGHILNVCRDRYQFAVGLAAAIVSHKVSLLPPTHTPDMVRRMQSHAPDVFCLYDQDDCTTALPRLRYPQLPPADEKTPSLLIPHIAADQLVALVFTSGSTGTPVPHQKHWGALVVNVLAQAERLKLHGNMHGACTVVGTIPPQHMYGFESTVLLAWQSGHALSSAQPFYPADICSAVADVPAPRLVVSTPLHLRLLLESGLTPPPAALVLSATAPLSTPLAHKVEAAFDAPLLEIYGSTETGQIATRRTTQTVAWQLLPEVRLSQRGDQTWAEGGHVQLAVPLNDIIELTDIEHTNVKHSDEAPGQFLLHGRTQDLINIAGKRTSLANLDHHLNSIPGVIDGAFYMPDEESPDHVTRLCACVQAPDLSSAELLQQLRARIDAAFLPRPLYFVAALPRNSTGKLPRDTLRAFVLSQHALHVRKPATTNSEQAVMTLGSSQSKNAA